MAYLSFFSIYQCSKVLIVRRASGVLKPHTSLIYYGLLQTFTNKHTVVQIAVYLKTSSTLKIIASQRGGHHNFKLHFTLSSKETDKNREYDLNF